MFIIPELQLKQIGDVISSEGALVAIPLPLFHITSSRTSKSPYNLLTHFKIFEDLRVNIQFFWLIDDADAVETTDGADVAADAVGGVVYAVMQLMLPILMLMG